MIHPRIFRSVSSNTRLRPAVFLDRDGTITVNKGYITRPEQIELIDDAALAFRRFSKAGYACVLITNQSAVGREMISEWELDVIHDVLLETLGREGITLDAIYCCPEAPIGRDETIAYSRDRKPGAGMLLQASKDLRLDLSRSWMIGDRLSDVLAGKNAGCFGSIRVRTGHSHNCPEPEEDWFVVDTLLDATGIVLAST